MGRSLATGFKLTGTKGMQFCHYQCLKHARAVYEGAKRVSSNLSRSAGRSNRIDSKRIIKMIGFAGFQKWKCWRLAILTGLVATRKCRGQRRW